MSRLKDVPELRRDGGNLNEVMQAVREVIQTYRGYRGDPLDQALTLRDLSSTAQMFVLGGGQMSGGVGGGAYPGNMPDSTIDPTPPPTPTGLLVSTGITSLFVTCDQPVYTQGHGHNKTIVYGAKWPTGGIVPTFADAVELFQFQGPFSAYTSDPATRWCVWIKWQSVDGFLSTDPAGGTNGAQATTAQNIAALLEVLTGEITASQLHATLGTRIDLIDTPTTGLQAQAAANNASITAINATLATLASTPPYDNATAYVTGNIATYGGALYKAIASTTGNIPTNVSFWTKIGDYASLGDAVAGHAVILSDHATRITTAEGAITAVAGRATVLEASVNSGTTGLATKASIAQVATAKSEAIAASASVTDTIIARLNTGDFAAVQVQSAASASSVTGLLAQYTVKLDVNGKVSGYGLASTGPTGTGSTFEVRADKFSIAAPTGSAAGYVPFSVLAVDTTIGGVVFPAGVYAQRAFIQDLQVTNAKIGALAVDNAKIANMSVAKLTAGSLQVGSYIQSTSYVAGTSGWKINADGTAELANATVRGAIYATSGYLRGLDIQDAAGNVILSSGNTLQNQIAPYTSGATVGATFGTNISGQITAANVSTYIADAAIGNAQINGDIYSSNWVYGSSGWLLQRSGAFYANSGEFRGQLVAASGTFAGNVTGGQFTTGAYTGYAWPAINNYGSYLGPSGLLLGNANNNKYLQVTNDGNIYAPGFSVVNGTMTISQANVINTLNLAGNSVTLSDSAFTAGSVRLAYGLETVLQQTAAFDATGAPVYISMCAEIYGGWVTNQTKTVTFYLHIYRNTTLVQTFTVLTISSSSGPGSGRVIVSVPFRDIPPAGSTTYYLRCSVGNGASNEYYYAQNRSLFTLETKR